MSESTATSREITRFNKSRAHRIRGVPYMHRSLVSVIPSFLTSIPSFTLFINPHSYTAHAQPDRQTVDSLTHHGRGIGIAIEYSRE